MQNRDQEPYRYYTEMPTILWIFGVLGISLTTLLLSNLFYNEEGWRMFFLTVGILAGSMGISVFLVAILYPFIKDMLKKPDNTDINIDDIDPLK
jgi:hypothetical protein